MPPGHTYVALWEEAPTLLADDYEYPVRICAQLEYKGLEGKEEYGAEIYWLDAAIYREQAVLADHQGSIAKSTKRIADQIKKWSDGNRGVKVRDTDAESQARRRIRPVHLRRAAEV